MVEWKVSLLTTWSWQSGSSMRLSAVSLSCSALWPVIACKYCMIVEARTFPGGCQRLRRRSKQLFIFWEEMWWCWIWWCGFLPVFFVLHASYVISRSSCSDKPLMSPVSTSGSFGPKKGDGDPDAVQIYRTNTKCSNEFPEMSSISLSSCHHVKYRIRNKTASSHVAHHLRCRTSDFYFLFLLSWLLNPLRGIGLCV